MNEREELNSSPYTITSCLYRKELIMHPQFRLWITTGPETRVPLPAVLNRYAIKLAWDCKEDFQSLVRQSFITSWNKQKHSIQVFKDLQVKEVQVRIILTAIRLSLKMF